MPTTRQNQHSPGHPSTTEHGIAVAIVLWVMFAGLCVMMANAWASGLV